MKTLKHFVLVGLSFLIESSVFPVYSVERTHLISRVETPEDRTLSDQVKNALAADGVSSQASQNITVGTVEGLVVLRGNVKSAQDKNLILMRVRQVPGVAGVQDEIQVRNTK